MKKKDLKKRIKILKLSIELMDEDLASMTVEAGRFRTEHKNACKQIAAMYEAAFDRSGPAVGFVEDMSHLRRLFMTQDAVINKAGEMYGFKWFMVPDDEKDTASGDPHPHAGCTFIQEDDGSLNEVDVVLTKAVAS